MSYRSVMQITPPWSVDRYAELGRFKLFHQTRREELDSVDLPKLVARVPAAVQ